MTYRTNYGGGYSSYPQQVNPRSYMIGIAIILLLAVLITSIETTIGRLIGLTIGFTVHEWAHAYTAMRLGDYTAHRQGRVTLDPRAHIDPIGIALALLSGFGWAKPVPVNPMVFYPRVREGIMLTALAGPVSNLIIGAFFGIALRLLDAAIPFGDYGTIDFLYRVIWTITIFNLALFLFNLIPLHPLDGWKIMLGVLPPENANQIAPYQEQSTRILMILLLVGLAFPPLNIIGGLISPPIRELAQLFSGF